MERKKLKKLIVEKNATMKATSTCLLNMEKKVATTAAEKHFLSKRNAALHDPGKWKGTLKTRTGDVFSLKIPFQCTRELPSMLKKPL